MKRQYNPHANIQPLAPVRLVEPRYPDGATRCKAREKLEAVLGLKIWVGDKDAIEAGRLLREVLGLRHLDEFLNQKTGEIVDSKLLRVSHGIAGRDRGKYL